MARTKPVGKSRTRELLDSPLGRLIVAIQDEKDRLSAVLRSFSPLLREFRPVIDDRGPSQSLVSISPPHPVAALAGDLLKSWESPTGENRRVWELASESIPQFHWPMIHELRAAHLALLKDSPEAARRVDRQFDGTIVARHCSAVVDAQAILRQAVEIQDRNAPEQAEDESAYVSASQLLRDTKKSWTQKRLVAFLHKEGRGIRTKKPNKQRLSIHAGDWHQHWAQEAAREFERLDGEAESVSDAAVREYAERAASIPRDPKRKPRTLPKK